MSETTVDHAELVEALVPDDRYGTDPKTRVTAKQIAGVKVIAQYPDVVLVVVPAGAAVEAGDYVVVALGGTVVKLVGKSGENAGRPVWSAVFPIIRRREADQRAEAQADKQRRLRVAEAERLRIIAAEQHERDLAAAVVGGLGDEHLAALVELLEPVRPSDFEGRARRLLDAAIAPETARAASGARSTRARAWET